MQLQDWLEALASSGQLAALLGANADLLNAYFAYFANGGPANGFTGLPIYADYVSALNAYYAYLAAGGLPGDYTALNQATIRFYLNALNRAGGLAAFGDLDTFFEDYYAFLRAGGDPASFSGLPAYASYVTALNAYYAYLAGGGVPSAYTVLTQQQIADYLAALNAAGGFSIYVALNAFFSGYYAYLAGGGLPDAYSGLPGGGGGGAITPPVQLAYTGGFNPATARINFVTTLTLGSGTTVPGSESGFEATSYTLGAGGGLTAYTRTGGTTRTNGTTTITDISGNADVLIGRWTNGTNTGANVFTLNANQGFHYMLARPVASDFALPAQGTIAYDLLAATRPTIVDGSVAPGTVTADMAILLGATAPKLGFEATFTMPGANGGANEVRRYATAGGVANPAQGGADLANFFGGVFGFRVDGVSGANCATSECYFQAQAAFAGDSDTIGLTYTARDDTGSSRALIGAMIFGNGTLSGGPAADPVLVTSGIFSSEMRRNSSNDLGIHPLNLSATVALASNPQGYEVDGNGAIVGLVRQSAFGGSDRIGTASNTDSGETASGGINWTRWTDGVVAAVRTAGPGGGISLSPDQGYHIITGTPATNLPTSGRVEYELVGGTRPTHEYGAAAPGTLVSGAAAVQFGAAPKVGIELEVDYNSATYLARTNGGLADLSASELTLSDGAFLAIGAFGNVTGGTCGTSCRAIWTGFLSGEGGREMGLEYIFQLGNSNNELIGVAAFAQASAATARVQAQALRTPMAPSSASGDWGRWSVPASGTPATPGFERGPGSAPAIGTLSARDAEAMLGGLVTFARPQ